MNVHTFFLLSQDFEKEIVNTQNELTKIAYRLTANKDKAN